MLTKTEAGGNTVALQNGLALVQILCDEGPLTIKEMAQRADLRENTAARLVKTLEMHGFVEPARFAERYQCGRTATALAGTFFAHTPIVGVAHPIMQSLAGAHDIAVVLAAPHGDNAICLMVCRGQTPGTGHARAGSTTAMDRSAAGQALLMSLRLHENETAPPLPDQSTLDRAGPDIPSTSDTTLLAERPPRSFDRTFGCHRFEHLESGYLLLATPIHLVDATLALEVALPPRARSPLRTDNIAKSLLAAASLIEQKATAAGIRYLDE